MSKVLLVDDDAAIRDALGQTIELAGLSAIVVRSVIEAKDHVSPDFDGIVVTDIRMPGKDGFDLLRHCIETDPDLPVILLTGEGDIPMAVKAMSEGAFDFLEKPCAPKDFIGVIQKGLRTRALVQENRRLKKEIARGDAASRMLFGTSSQAEALRKRCREVAKSSAEVLITGPQGSGTSKVAEVIHLLSGGSTRAFVKIAVAGLSAGDLSDSFQRANGGTLYLDEISLLSPAAQFALLDLLDKGQSVRVIAGTYQDMQAAVHSGRFNSDLLYRLDVLRVRIPSLKERADDIPVLFRHYVEIACEQAAIPVPEISAEMIGALMAKDWPGNARGLMNAAMRFVMGQNDLTAAEEGLGLAEQMAKVERSILAGALERHGGRASETAEALKLPRKTFYDKLARHGLRPEDFREP